MIFSTPNNKLHLFVKNNYVYIETPPGKKKVAVLVCGLHLGYDKFNKQVKTVAESGVISSKSTTPRVLRYPKGQVSTLQCYKTEIEIPTLCMSQGEAPL